MALDVEVPRRLFTVDEYHRMGEAGILGEDERVELIEGEIVQMTPIATSAA
jgi:Uma2 family endonuclease